MRFAFTFVTLLTLAGQAALAQENASRFSFVDLTPLFNHQLGEPLHDFDLGNPDLAALAGGTYTCCRIPFQIGGGCLQLGSRHPDLARFPRAIGPIPVDQTCKFLHFLHTTNLGSRSRAPRKNTGEYEIRYDDGTTDRLPILRDEITCGASAWRPRSIDSTNGRGCYWGALGVTSWKNPHPTKRVKSVSVRPDGDYLAALCCVAITADRESKGSDVHHERVKHAEWLVGDWTLVRDNKTWKALASNRWVLDGKCILIEVNTAPDSPKGKAAQVPPGPFGDGRYAPSELRHAGLVFYDPSAKQVKIWVFWSDLGRCDTGIYSFRRFSGSGRRGPRQEIRFDNEGNLSISGSRHHAAPGRAGHFGMTGTRSGTADPEGSLPEDGVRAPVLDRWTEQLTLGRDIPGFGKKGTNVLGIGRSVDIDNASFGRLDYYLRVGEEEELFAVAFFEKERRVLWMADRLGAHAEGNWTVKTRDGGNLLLVANLQQVDSEGHAVSTTHEVRAQGDDPAAVVFQIVNDLWGRHATTALISPARRSGLALRPTIRGTTGSEGRRGQGRRGQAFILHFTVIGGSSRLPVCHVRHGSTSRMRSTTLPRGETGGRGSSSMTRTAFASCGNCRITSRRTR